MISPKSLAFTTISPSSITSATLSSESKNILTNRLFPKYATKQAIDAYITLNIIPVNKPFLHLSGLCAPLF